MSSAASLPWIARLRTAFFGPPLPPHQLLGRRGEKIAACSLRRRGYKILATNFLTTAGEADIVALAPESSERRRRPILVEVKSRIVAPGSTPFAGVNAAESAVDDDKRRRLLRIARHLARANNWPVESFRIDVIAIDFPAADGLPEIRHHIDALRTMSGA